jgi:hypothetical protein
MLRIRQVKTYRIAKYPQGEYRPKQQHPAVGVATQGILSVLLLALVDSCEGPGTTGPPPIAPDLLTENEARILVEKVFNNNSIQLTRDYKLEVALGDNDTLSLDLDGYNDSLQVGYEYIGQGDELTFKNSVVNTLDSLNSESGPYIDPIPPTYTDQEYREYLEKSVQEFIDSLKAEGVI